MGGTVHWATYERPLPADHPVRHFQQSRNAHKHIRWIDGRLACWEWPPDGMNKYEKRFASNAEVAAFERELVAEGFSRTDGGSYPAGPTDYRAMTESIKQYVIEAWAGFRERLAEEKLCGFALASDGDGMTLDARANTLKAVEERNSSLSRDEAFFIVAEWPHGDRRRTEKPFIELMNRKREFEVPFDRQVSFAKHKKQFFEACISALEAARREGLFPDQDREDFAVLFAVMDDFEIPRMCRRLNPPRLAVRYRKLQL